MAARNALFASIVVSFAVSGLGFAEEAHKGPAIVVCALGDFPTNVAEATAEHLGRHLRVKCVNATSHVERTNTAESQIRVLSLLLRQTQAVWCLGLILDPDYTNIIGRLSQSNGVAIVNCAAFGVANASPSRSIDPVSLRLVEGEGVSAMARLAGLAPCPNPKCCLHVVRTRDELSQRGVNLCPPCGGKFDAIAEKAGLVREYARPNMDDLRRRVRSPKGGEKTPSKQ